ncbi:MAG: hypothetical protein Q9227_003690 [Pyrenula ochraceoflavens]
MDLLQPTIYQPATRQVRGTQLNTIIEHPRETNFRDSKSGLSSSDEGTIVGRPSEMDPNVFVAAGRRPKRDNEYMPSPLSGMKSAIGDREWSDRPQFDDMYDVSDDETEFSESSSYKRDSGSSRPTSFATDSTRSSLHSNRSSRNRYPSIQIPASAGWPSLNKPHKSSPVPPTPPPKIPVSPAVLSLLPKFVPSVHAPPSLDGSVTSSDRHSNVSAPVTPELQMLIEGDAWGGSPAVHLHVDPDLLRTPISASSPIIPEDDVVIERSDVWDTVAGTFPTVPMNEDASPVLPPIDTFDNERPQTPSDAGVELPSDALRTLHQLAPDRTPDPLSETSSVGRLEGEMQELPIPPSRPRSADGVTPGSELSGYSFSQLSIPSPGGFFRSLKPGSRHTWAPGQLSNPPSSTTAENFYNVPWLEPKDNIIEQIVEADENVTDGPPTARQPPQPATANLVTSGQELHQLAGPETQGSVSGSSSLETVQEIKHESPRPIVYEYEEAYEEELLQSAVANLDRTSVWLSAQATYLAALRETNPQNDLNADPLAERGLKKHGRGESLDSPLKKVVRFLESEAKESNEVLKIESRNAESVYYQGFQHVKRSSRRRDSFVQSPSRFEAIQADRVAMPDQHIDQLMGKFEIKEPQRPKYVGPFSQNPRATGMDWTPAQMAFIRCEREQAALDQLSAPFWVVEAMKFLNGGKLFAGPAARRLSRAVLPLDHPDCVGRNRVRVLDLGGQGVCDWAWHCAREWRNVKTYTVVTKEQAANPTAKGPSNHRQVSVPRLWQLPFRDNYFDVISVRSLYTLLKMEQVVGESFDEYDLTLQECYRVLKPGGYLEFMLMDSMISHAGPRGTAMSVEFGFNLKTRGYDPAPTKAWLGRLRKARFAGIKRAWMFLPMGTPSQVQEAMREAPPPNPETPVDANAVEAVLGPVGSTRDVASITGILGGWLWEQWMLKLQIEMGYGRERLLEGVARVIEEGRNGDAGWECLSGWARKPKVKARRRETKC